MFKITAISVFTVLLILVIIPVAMPQDNDVNVKELSRQERVAIGFALWIEKEREFFQEHWEIEFKQEDVKIKGYSPRIGNFTVRMGKHDIIVSMHDIMVGMDHHENNPGVSYNEDYTASIRCYLEDPLIWRQIDEVIWDRNKWDE